MGRRFPDPHRRWPTRKDGPIGQTPNTWSAVDAALKRGLRGLNGGSSLAELLLARRGRRHKKYLPHLTAAAILAWADAHHARTGHWPTRTSGEIVGAAGEAWSAVNRALVGGHRGLATGGSLARLLSEHRGVRLPADLPRLESWEVLMWADAHRERTGHWGEPQPHRTGNSPAGICRPGTPPS